MKDKLIIIATIQFIIENMRELLLDPPQNKSQQKLGVLKALSLVLFNIYFSITGNLWQASGEDLTKWMLRYIKDEADKLGDNSKIIRIN